MHFMATITKGLGKQLDRNSSKKGSSEISRPQLRFQQQHIFQKLSGLEKAFSSKAIHLL